ncbi:MAG: thioesterase family protein [Pirellulaceae bacterium]
MKRPAKVGDVGELTFTATTEHAIDFADDRMPAVLSTPWLIWFLEHAARNAMLPLLDDGESTVGTHVDVEHLAATPLGQSVRCKATVINTDHPRITFRLEAHDEHEQIAIGIHRLNVIDCERFKKRLLKKGETLG